MQKKKNKDEKFPMAPLHKISDEEEEKFPKASLNKISEKKKMKKKNMKSIYFVEEIQQKKMKKRGQTKKKTRKI